MRNNFNPIKKCFINPLIQHEVFYQSYNPITVFPTISGRKRKVVDFPRTGSHWFRNSFIELSSLPSSPSSFLWHSLSKCSDFCTLLSFAIYLVHYFCGRRKEREGERERWLVREKREIERQKESERGWKKVVE